MSETTHVIEFGPKFCQAQFDFVFRDELTVSDGKGGIKKEIVNHWEKSFSKEVTEVIFDLSITEWVSTEEIAFLFAWIRNLKNSEKKLSIKLPYRFNLESTGYFGKAKLAELAEKYKEVGGSPYKENDIRIKRRSRSNLFLLVVYGLFDRLGLSDGQFENMADPASFNKASRELHQNNHQIIPFTTFDLTFNKQHIKFDTHFHEVINNNFDAQHKTARIFELQNEIQDLLRSYACYSPFESKILSNVITQEIYINSLQHSFENVTENNFLTECYVTAFLANKWPDANIFPFVPSFTEEKYADTLDFYKDKEKILSEINLVLKDPKYKSTVPREADLTNYKSHFKNRSFLEFTFLDFGQGIHNSLKPEFEKAISEEGLMSSEGLSKDFANANIDSQIIEYAFLMDTSKNPLQNTIEHYELVPRGLYFLVDMVRRYKGLLIARSGSGKVVYDFSEKVVIENAENKPTAKIVNTYKIKDAVKHQDKNRIVHFPGTMFTIVLPERASDMTSAVVSPVRTDENILADYAYSLSDKQFQIPDHPKTQFYPESFEYISILFIYNAVIEELKAIEEEIHVKDIYNRLFQRVNEALDKHKGQNCIIFFDFAGLSTGNASWIKILYFLINTPKVNENTKAIIVNLPSDEGKIIKQLKQNLSGVDISSKKKVSASFHDPFLFRPIPCVNFKIDVQNEHDLIEWIGLKNPDDEVLLTNLLLGKKDGYSIDSFATPGNTEGSLFVKSDGRIHATIAGLNNLKTIFLEKQKEVVANFLTSYVINGYDEEKKIENHIYLASNGAYQYKYLSLYELLHDKYVARYFAKCLLDKYCFYIESEFAKLQEQYPKSEEFIFKKNARFKEFKFNRIIAVTVSSQLVGVAIRDLIEEDDNYSFLREDNKVTGVPDAAPELIMLSSYYSFETEKPFEKIKDNDRVLIVNDVISTGSLVGKLLRKIENEKKAIVNAVFSIADTRIPNSKIDTEKEIKSEFFGHFEDNFFSMATFEEGLVLRKYIGPYSGTAEEKRINPLLNSIVELKAVHGEQNKILFPKSSDLINDVKISPKYFRVGHFQQNLTHNGYLTDMRPLFSSQEGVYIIEKLKKELEKKYINSSVSRIKDQLNVRLVNISDQISTVNSVIGSENYTDIISGITKDINNLKEKIGNDVELNSKHTAFNPDFIFYPVFSGIEKMSHFKLSHIFNTHPDNIIGLQRFETPKGWRFPFPAKRFNHLTRGKSILIIDSGSLTGESLVQLIDNIGFLDVKEIVVLSVITRVEDFYREFYSRLKSIKVKRYRGKSKVDKTTAENGQEEALFYEMGNVVPIEILFGINLHIPAYSSSVSCPFCEERKKLNDTTDNSHIAKLTHEVKEYLALRQTELRYLNPAKETLKNISYLPLLKDTEVVDTKGIFNTRDLLGKIDSHRFYPEYFYFFKDLLLEIINDELWYEKDKIKKELERILICLLHEPYLIDLIHNYLGGLIHYIHEYLRRVLLREKLKLEELFYKWDIYSLTQLWFLLLRDEILTLEKFEKILSCGDNKSLLFLHYKFWDILYNKNSNNNLRTKVELLLRGYSDNYSEKQKSNETIYNPANYEFVRLLTRPYEINDIEKYPYLDVPFNNLSKFVLQGESQGRHFFLKGKLNDVIDSIVSTKPSINQIIQQLGEVIVIFDDELKPNVERILADDNIKESCKTIYSFLAIEKKGILLYMNELENAYHKIIKVKQEDIESVRAVLSEILESCKIMINSTLTFHETKECFYRTCKQYPCNFNDSLSEFKQKENADLKININDNTGDYFINFHRQVFESVLNEILKNAKEKWKHDLTIDVNYHLLKDDSSLKVMIKQNHPFVPNSEKPNGGLSNIITHFVEHFGGAFSDNRKISISNQEDYQITLILKLHAYAK